MRAAAVVFTDEKAVLLAQKKATVGDVPLVLDATQLLLGYILRFFLAIHQE